ncbi:hypothetical protein VN23_02685 [Janthinobacterium sp. B9-8]|nr:hypothetical protein VN23_02685 [Janthinobacterium sp. B9-8]
MDRQKLQVLAAELAKDIKTEADLNALSRELLKLTVETALNAELTDHLGDEKHASTVGERGLKGFPDAIAVEFPHTRVQLCIVLMVCNSIRSVFWKDYKAVTADLKRLYQSSTEEQALMELERFTQTWQANYPLISKSWTANWAHLRTIFEYPPESRKAIYTTNAIELLNSMIRSATKRVSFVGRVSRRRNPRFSYGRRLSGNR